MMQRDKLIYQIPREFYSLPLSTIFIMFFTQFNKNFLLKIFISFYHKKYPLNVDLVFFWLTCLVILIKCENIFFMRRVLFLI